MTMMQQIKIGPEFFIKERDNAYANFGEAFWRENIQNSVDAGATEIHIQSHVIDSKENLYDISFADNGCGMTKDVLENVFFCLGATTKNTQDSIGGFARARIMTHFASQNYTIHTQDNHVKGKAVEYCIEKGEHYSGCKMTFLVKAKDKYNYSINMNDYLFRYLSSCQLPCKVFVNGIQFNDWLYKRKVTTTLDFAKVYVNKSQQTCTIIVRVNGVTMFQMGSSYPYRIIVELNPEISRMVLSSSRDNFVYQYASKWDYFLITLAQDAEKALKNCDEEKIKFHGKSIKRLNSAKSMKCPAEKANLPALTTDAYGISPILVTQQTNFTRIETYNYVDLKEEKIPFSFVTYENLGEIVEHKAEHRKQIKAYDPINWHKDGVIRNKNKAKLILAWTSICEDIIQILCDSKKNESLEILWATGFCFSSARAMRTKQDGINIIMINPLDEQGKNRFKLTNKNDINELIATAIHEVCHILVSDHNASFAILQTELTHQTIQHINNIKKKAKQEIEQVDNFQFGR